MEKRNIQRHVFLNKEEDRQAGVVMKVLGEKAFSPMVRNYLACKYREMEAFNPNTNE